MKNKLSTDIWNCEDVFTFQCPMKLEELTGEGKERFCKSCSKNVYICETPEEFIKHSSKGECVAVPNIARQSKISTAVLGRPSIEASEKAIEWWEKVIDSGSTLDERLLKVVKDNIEGQKNWRKQSTFTLHEVNDEVVQVKNSNGKIIEYPISDFPKVVIERMKLYIEKENHNQQTKLI